MIFTLQKNLSDVCTLGIGGPAKYYVEVKSAEEMKGVIVECQKRKLRYFILGKGSNTLFDDKGFNGVVIHNKIDFFEEIEPGRFHVGGGYSFSLLGSRSARMGWSGLEFAAGIPGSVGGAVYMNAGANGEETFDPLLTVDYLTDEGEVIIFKKNQLVFSYRSSSFQTMTGVILGATFSLKKFSGSHKKKQEIVEYRIRTQPYTEKSAGCMFRNPPGQSAGSLIEKCGLKNTSYGGARVSDLHANFVINGETATSKDILNLVKTIKDQVKEKAGIELESEVRYLPYD